MSTPAAAPGAAGQAQLYDFHRPNRFSREHVRALQIVNETFARQFATVLSTTLRSIAQANVLSVGQITYDEYVRRLPSPSLLAVLSLDPMPGAGVFQLPMGIVMNAVDRLLGGQGGEDQPNRALSDIETSLARQLVERVVHELTYAFESLTRLVAKVGSLESDAQFMQLAPPSEPVIVSSIEVRIGDHTAICTLCLPFGALQPVLDAVGIKQASPGAHASAMAAARALGERLMSVPVDVTVAFRPMTLTSGEVLALDVGDLLPLRHPVAEPLTIAADGIAIAAAVPGSDGPRLACQVVAPELRGTP